MKGMEAHAKQAWRGSSKLCSATLFNGRFCSLIRRGIRCYIPLHDRQLLGTQTMLNQFKNRTKLTVVFFSVIAFLIIVTDVAYFAFDTSQKSIQSMLQIDLTRANILAFRIDLNRAQLATTSGSLFRDLEYHKDWQVIDKKIANLADSLQQTLDGENLENLHRLLVEYERFKGIADQWARFEEERVELEANLIAMGNHTMNLIHKCIEDFTADVEEQFAKKMEDEEKYVQRDLIRPAMELEELALDMQALCRRYYLMVAETNHEEQQILGKALENTVDTLVAALRDLARKTTNTTRRGQIEEVDIALQKWGTIMREVITLLHSQSQNDLDLTATGGRMTEILTKMVEFMGHRLNTLQKEMAASDALMVKIMIGTALAAVIAGICCGLILNNYIGNGIDDPRSHDKNDRSIGKYYRNW